MTTAERDSVNSKKAFVRDVQQALDIGFTDVLVKPIDGDYLLRQICEIESPSQGHMVPVTASLDDARHPTPQVEQLSHHMRAVREIISCLAEKADSLITHRDDVIRRLNELESLIPPAARD